MPSLLCNACLNYQPHIFVGDRRGYIGRPPNGKHPSRTPDGPVDADGYLKEMQPLIPLEKAAKHGAYLKTQEALELLYRCGVCGEVRRWGLLEGRYTNEAEVS